MKFFFLPTATLLIAGFIFSSPIDGSAKPDHDHDHLHDHDHAPAEPTRNSSRVVSLEVEVRPQRDGMIEVEKKFLLDVDGVGIRRGPILNYMTVFRSSGGLIVDTAMEILEVTRNGVKEPFLLSSAQGNTAIMIGAKEVILEPGLQAYTIRYRRLGSWTKEGGDLVDVFDGSEPFRSLPIDSATARLVLPDGASFTRRSGAVYGTTARGPGFTMTLEDDAIEVKTTAPLNRNHSILLNTAWAADGFSAKSKWTQIIQQHPLIPMTAIASVVMALALVLLIVGGNRRAKERKSAAVAV